MMGTAPKSVWNNVGYQACMDNFPTTISAISPKVAKTTTLNVTYLIPSKARSHGYSTQVVSVRSKRVHTLTEMDKYLNSIVKRNKARARHLRALIIKKSNLIKYYKFNFKKVMETFFLTRPNVYAPTLVEKINFNQKIINYLEQLILSEKILRRNIKKNNLQIYINKNKHNFNLLSIDPEMPQIIYEAEEDELVCSSLIIKTVEEFDFSRVDQTPCVYNTCVEPVQRDSVLAIKLRRIIQAFSNLRIRNSTFSAFLKRNFNNIKINSKVILDYFNLFNNQDGEELNDIELQEIEVAEEAVDQFYDVELPPWGKCTSSIYLEPQMENSEGDCSSIATEQKENVVLTTHAEESVAKPISITGDNWEKLCSPQNVKEYSQLMSRWQKYSKVTWSQDQPNNFQLLDVSLPIDFIMAKNSSPNCLMFKQYAFVKFDMEIKIVMNTNKFHCGQLQGSFYYGANLDSKYAVRSNIYSASQMTHCILDAGAASDGILKIPYRHYKPLMGTTKRQDDSAILDLGRFRLFVLNSLKLPAGDTNKVDVTIFMRFLNPSFHGMQPSVLGLQAQMMESLGAIKQIVNQSANLLNQVYPDNQRDNPTDIIPPKPIVPWSSHSWCLGDLTSEPTQVLRLQASGNTTHPPGTLPNEPESEISYINNIFGLIKQVVWNNTQPSGTILSKIEFSPSLSNYPLIKIDGFECDVMPPVSVMANLFAYWRGSLEYRLDFVSTQFHTGRLILAYLPRLIVNNITIDLLTSCDHVILDLREAKRFSYINSFLSDKPWWPRRSTASTSTELYPPGYIYIGVVNQLTATPSVATSIDINLYLRAGSDFELHVPVSPSIALSFNTQIYESATQSFSPLDDYGPPKETIYVGEWRGVDGKLVMRYGPVTDHITQFNWKDSLGEAVVPPKLCKFDSPRNVVIKHPAYPNLPYLVLFPSSDGVYLYGAPFDYYSQAYQFYLSVKKVGEVWQYNTKLMLSSKGLPDGDYLQAVDKYFWLNVPVTTNGFEIINNMDERKDECSSDILEVQRNVASTNKGLLTFGEQIYSIKQLFRRYMPYGTFYNKEKVSSVPYKADFCFPVMPQGLDFNVVNSDGTENIYANRIRDGLIPIMASGYRFYRGSIRFRIIIIGRKEGCFWVQHRPEYNLTELGVSIPNSRFKSAYYQPNYAYTIQLSKMNNVVEFEVPFYLPGQFGLLQRPNLNSVEDAVHFSLGAIYCGFDVFTTTTAETPYIAQIFYSMGDDMSFSVFQGFPPMFSLSRFDEMGRIQCQMEKSEPSTSKGFITGIKEKINNKVNDYVNNKVADTINTVVTEQTQEIVTELPKDAPDEKTKDIITMLKTQICDLSPVQQSIIISIFTNLIHSAINPNIKTFVWSLVSVLMHMGLIIASAFEILIKYFSKILNNFNTYRKNWSKKSDKGPEAQSPGDHEQSQVECALVSTCVTGLLSLIGAKSKPIPKSIPSFANYLYDGIPKFTLSANGLFRFFQNNLIMFKRMWTWLFSYFYPSKSLASEFYNATDAIKDFVTRVQWISDERNYDQIRNDMNATIEAYRLANTASSYLAKRALMEVEESKRLPIFDSYCRKAIQVRDKLAAEMISLPFRFEPFVVSLIGKSNIGKSHLAQKLSLELLQCVDYKSSGELIYTRTPGVPHWNGLRNQPVCLFDDFLALVDPTFGLQQAGELFCLKSKATFNPPMAELNDKKIRYNPLLVMLCANTPYPVVNGINCPEALYRRRDIMIHCEKKAAYKDKHPRYMSRADKRSYAHLEFSIYADPGSKSNNGYGPYTYPELLSVLFNRFNEFFAEESLQYDQTILDFKKFIPDPTLPTSEYEAKVSDFIEKLNKKRSKDNDLDPGFMTQITNHLENFKYKGDSSKFLYNNMMQQALKDYDAIIPVKPTLIGKDIIKLPVVNIVDKPKIIAQNSDTSDDEIESPSYNIDECLAHLVQHGKSKYILNKLNLEKFKTMKFKEKPDPLVFMIFYYCNFIVKDITKYPNPDDSVLHHEIVKKLTEFCIVNSLDDDVFDCHCVARTIFAQEIQILGSKLVIGCRFPVNPIKKNRFPKIGVFEYDADEVCTNPGCFKTLERGKHQYYLVMSKLLSGVNEQFYPQLYIDYSKQLMESKSFITLTEFKASEIQQELDDVKENIFRRFLKKLPNWSTILKYLMKLITIMASIAAILSLSRVIKDAVKPADKNPDSVWLKHTLEQGPKYSAGTVAAKSKHVIAPKILGQSSTSLEDVIATKVRRNTFWLLVEYETEGIAKSKLLRCLGFTGHHFIFLDHYHYFIKSLDNPSVYYCLDSVKIKVNYSEIRFKNLYNSALLVGLLPLSFPQFVNLVKFMIPSNSTRNISNNAYLLEYKLNNNKIVLEKERFPLITRVEGISIDNDDSSVSLVDHAYAYPKGGRGMCGSVLISDSNIPYPLLGIHVAGYANTDQGFAEAIVRETFESFVDVVTGIEPSEYSIINNMEIDKEAKIALYGVRKLGVIPKSHSQYPPVKSRLINTICASQFGEITYDKPVLTSKDERIKDAPFSPLVEGCLNHGDPILPLPIDVIAKAAMDVEHVIMSAVKPQRISIGKLTLEQAVVGIKENPLYEGMPLDTSEGYPWILRRPAGASNKSWMFKIDDDRNLTWVDPDLLSTLQFTEQERKLGRFFDTPFVDCLKDAKLPKEKVLEPGKTRIFSISPVDYTISVRQYTQDFVVAYQAARFRAEHAIGIDISSLETNILVNKMLSFSPNLITADYSKFGDKLYATCVNLVFEIIIGWYVEYGRIDNEYGRVIKCLGAEVKNAIHIALDLVYQCYCGMPSGNPLTVVINSMVNSMYCRVIWMLIAENHGVYRGLDKFNECVKVVTYGDDLFLSVTEEAIGYYNAVTMGGMWKKFGQKFTGSVKDGKVQFYNKITDPEVTFLKCTFVRHPHRNIWMARMEKRVVLETSNWTWTTNKDERANAIQACKSMMELAFGHGPEFYDNLRNKVILYWNKENYKIELPTWSDVDHRIYNEI